MSDDHFSDFDEASTATPVAVDDGLSSDNRNYSTEVFSQKISAKYRTFFIDVKENSNGHLVKISEKSRGGKKSTVMLDAEDLQSVIDALVAAKASCER